LRRTSKKKKVAGNLEKTIPTTTSTLTSNIKTLKKRKNDVSSSEDEGEIINKKRRTNNKSKNVPIKYDEHNLDKDFVQCDTSTIETIKCKFGNNMVLKSHIVDCETKSGNYSFPALGIHKKMPDNNAFIFNIPLVSMPNFLNAQIFILKKLNYPFKLDIDE
jgi:hypothetical protein